MVLITDENPTYLTAYFSQSLRSWWVTSLMDKHSMQPGNCKWLSIHPSRRAENLQGDTDLHINCILSVHTVPASQERLYTLQYLLKKAKSMYLFCPLLLVKTKRSNCSCFFLMSHDEVLQSVRHLPYFCEGGCSFWIVSSFT